MPTVAHSPLYQVAGRELSSVFTMTESGANFLRLWCTAAPEGSELDTKLKEAAASRIEVYAGDGNNPAWRHTFDKGGRYTFAAQEYQRGTGFSGGYQDDTRANTEEDPLPAPGSETTITIHIGQRCTSLIGIAPDSGTLAFHVWDDTIRETTLSVHGENTPAIVDTTTAKGRNAALSTATAAAVLALKNVAMTTAVGTPATILENLVTKINAHLATDSTVHDNSDTTINKIKVESGGAPSPASLPDATNEILLKLRRHMTQNDGFGVGSADGTTDPVTGYIHEGPWHVVGTNKSDALNVPLYQSVSGPEETYGGLADAYRSYEAHRASSVVHSTADSTNTLTAIGSMPGIFVVHVRFLESLAAISPTASAGEMSGVQYFQTWAGGKAS